MKKVDRVKDWQKFSDHMVDYLEAPKKKYGEDDAVDLMAITTPIICIWNILKYALRNWYNHGKNNDLEKIAHYAQIAWTLGKGK